MSFFGAVNDAKKVTDEVAGLAKTKEGSQALNVMNKVANTPGAVKTLTTLAQDKNMQNMVGQAIDSEIKNKFVNTAKKAIIGNEDPDEVASEAAEDFATSKLKEAQQMLPNKANADPDPDPDQSNQVSVKSEENITNPQPNNDPNIKPDSTASDQAHDPSLVSNTDNTEAAANPSAKIITGEASYEYEDTLEGPKKIKVTLNPTTSGGSKRQSKKRKAKRKSKRKSTKRKSRKRKSKKKL